MESKPIGHPAEGLRPFLTVTSQADFAEALRHERLSQGLTLVGLEERAGFHEGYASHLEKPFTRTGKKSFKLTPMALIWLQALRLRLILAPLDCTSSAFGLLNDCSTTETRMHLPHPRPAPWK